MVPSFRKDDILIIQNSIMTSSANRRYHSTSSFYEEKSVWDNATGAFLTAVNGHSTQKNEKPSLSNIDLEMKALLERFQNANSIRMSRLEEHTTEIQKLKDESLNYLLRILFQGRKTEPVNSNPGSSTSMTTAVPSDEELGTGGSYKSFYYCEEREATCFETSGTVVTADGREISFNISLEMSRSFTAMASEQIDFGQPRLCDPLVINLNTDAVSVSDQKFFFDLDADGTKEEISMLDAASGYLSLDKNNDGIINDGSELFGTTSGNGFADLLAYDTDKNGWIDEADDIFHKLRIWSMDAQGNSTLVDLKTAGVGAIYLGYEKTDFSLNNEQNITNAIVRATGMFLYEDGDVGTVQQMDLAI